MKKIMIILLVISISFSFASCSELKIQGLDSYSKELCSVGTTDYLFPDESFLAEFKYRDGNFHFYEDGGSFTLVTTIAYLTYSDTDYEQAKVYCQEKFVLSEEHVFTYNGYHFAENLCNSVANDNLYEYPEQFNMFGYNDEKQTLIFIGYCNSYPNDKNKQLAETDFGAFLELYFSQYYDFSE